MRRPKKLITFLFPTTVKNAFFLARTTSSSSPPPPPPPPSWLSTNHIFQKHPRLQILLQCRSLRRLGPVLAYSIVLGLFHNPFVASRILHAAANLDLSFASSLFNRMENPNSFSYNTMIDSFSNNPSPALALFSQMLRRGVSPDTHTFTFLLKLPLSNAKICKLLHAHVVVLGFQHDPFVNTALLTACFESGSLHDALTVFDKMPHRDVVSWTAAISGLVCRDCHAQALQVFNSMRNDNSGATPNVATVVSVMSACAELGSYEVTGALHAYVEKTGFGGKLFVRNSLIDSYAKCGSVASASWIFRRMDDRDLFSWTTMITGFAWHGLGREAVDVFFAMQRVGVVPDTTAFVAVLSACSHAGLVEEGIKIFDSMQTTPEIVPDLKHYGCMVDLYSRAGLFSRAYDVVSSMPMEPNLVILGALLSACRMHSNLEFAKLVVKKIESVCRYHGGAPVLLSNMYANQNRWCEVVSIREAARIEDGKPQGRSWIELRGVVHEFGVEDRSHPLAREMSLVLDELGKLMKGFIVVILP